MYIKKSLLQLESKLYVLGIQQDTIDIVKNASVDIEFPCKDNNYNTTELKKYIAKVDTLLENFNSDYDYDYRLIQELRELLDDNLPF